MNISITLITSGAFLGGFILPSLLTILRPPSKEVSILVNSITAFSASFITLGVLL